MFSSSYLIELRNQQLVKQNQALINSLIQKQLNQTSNHFKMIKPLQSSLIKQPINQQSFEILNRSNYRPYENVNSLIINNQLRVPKDTLINRSFNQLLNKSPRFVYLNQDDLLQLIQSYHLKKLNYLKKASLKKDLTKESVLIDEKVKLKKSKLKNNNDKKTSKKFNKNDLDKVKMKMKMIKKVSFFLHLYR